MGKLNSLTDLKQRFCWVNGQLYPDRKSHPCRDCDCGFNDGTPLCLCGKIPLNKSPFYLNYESFYRREEWDEQDKEL